MMGLRQVEQAALFYEFSLDKHIPADHLLRSIRLRFTAGVFNRIGQKRNSTKVPLGSEITSSARGPQGHASSDRNAYFHSGRANSGSTTRPSNCPYRPHRPVAVAQWLRPVRFWTSTRRSNLQPRAQELDATLRLSIVSVAAPSRVKRYSKMTDRS